MTRRFRSLAAVALFAPSIVLAQRAETAAVDSLARYARVHADDARLARLKVEVTAEVEKMREFTQQMVDQIFSFGELGFQEEETSRYLTGVLEKNGFRVQRGVAGMPTAWLATWGSGKPVIALGSDVDGIPQASQKPGVAYHDPLVAGAPGHGEGHNSGQAVNITAAIAVKRIMERDRIPGTIKIWPGTAEELVGAKAYFVRDGMFKDADAALFSHVGNDFRTSWGQPSGNGLVSVEFTFTGTSAHSAGSPWRGRSALDAVELMNIGWNFRREHLRLQQRSHYVIRNGGDQPNVVPTNASVWYYFRETEYPRIMDLWKAGEEIANGAAMMTGTTMSGMRVLGTAWPQHMNRPIAEQMTKNIQAVGMPRWDAKDQELAKAVQREVKAATISGLDTVVRSAPDGPIPADRQMGGGSDDIGDVSWNVPTITLRFPSNIPDLPGHNWANAISMATPIAHKGATAGAKAMAMTILDLTMKPALLADAWSYFNDVQTKTTKYTPLIRPQDRPAIELNKEIMAKYRDEMRKYYYDPTRFKTYLEQLGIEYPTIKKAATTS